MKPALAQMLNVAVFSFVRGCASSFLYNSLLHLLNFNFPTKQLTSGIYDSGHLIHYNGTHRF